MDVTYFGSEEVNFVLRKIGGKKEGRKGGREEGRKGGREEGRKESLGWN
jgi:hypothetical protein